MKKSMKKLCSPYKCSSAKAKFLLIFEREPKLKLPGVGTALNSFMHVSVIGHGMLELAIIYKTTNAYGVTIHKMQNYEIYSDDRHPNIQNIKAIIDSLLSQALSTNAVIKITIDEARNYVWVGGEQYSGRLVL